MALSKILRPDEPRTEIVTDLEVEWTPTPEAGARSWHENPLTRSRGPSRKPLQNFALIRISMVLNVARVELLSITL